ncbi:MAG TPA: tetratricopeptide repeat protein [Pyrinomonadaceae bacterium]|nr:tetratricopeptide repeat protein [Pyrinomonadaceae bacterium]
MFLQTSPVRKLIFGFAVTACLLSLGLEANAQIEEPPEWKRGLELYEAQNFVAAVPLLEKAAQARPNDIHVLSRLGFALYAISATDNDPTRQRKMLDRARQVLEKSRSLGDNSNLTQITLDALAREGEIVPFSQIKSADAAIHEGEAAFVRGDFDAAIKSYKRALELDPKLYDAALYAGDSEFKKAYLSKDPKFRAEHFEQAGIWFAKAIAIDENRETAHRYWGDALDIQGKVTDARAKFVEAIVAEPFNRRGYMGLSQWAERHMIPMGHPRIVVPAKVSRSNSGDVSIAIDEKAMINEKDGSTAWILYGLSRSRWITAKSAPPSEKFTKAYPQETAYRHSLAEETEALRTVAESAERLVQEKKATELDPSLANLIRLKDVDLLEAYVFFARANQGIAHDYPAYRRVHREKLRRYWLEVVIQK